MNSFYLAWNAFKLNLQFLYAFEEERDRGTIKMSIQIEITHTHTLTHHNHSPQKHLTNAKYSRDLNGFIGYGKAANQRSKAKQSRASKQANQTYFSCRIKEELKPTIHKYVWKCSLFE